MALPSSGQISLGDIAGEISLVISNISLNSASTLNLMNLNSANRPDGVAPHAISEFLGYDHSASSGLKAMMGSTNQGNSAKPGDQCDNLNNTFYWHSGSRDIPELGNIVYLQDSSSGEIAENGVYMFSQGLTLGGESWTVGARVEGGKIAEVVTCEERKKGDLLEGIVDEGEGTPFEGVLPISEDPGAGELERPPLDGFPGLPLEGGPLERP